MRFGKRPDVPEGPLSEEIKFGVCERRACRVLQQHRSTYRYVPKSSDDGHRLVQDMIELAVWALRLSSYRSSAERCRSKWVGRLLRREGLKVPMKQLKKSWLWLNDGSCIVSVHSKSVTFGHQASFGIGPKMTIPVDAKHSRQVQSEVFSDQSEEKAQFDGCYQCAERSTHHSRCSNLCSL